MNGRKQDGVLTPRPFVLPEFTLQRADFAAQSVGRLRGFIQLPLQLPAGSRGSLGLLLRLLQLPLQLLHAGVRLFRLVSKGHEFIFALMSMG